MRLPQFNHLALTFVENIGLLVIAIATVVAGAAEVRHMFDMGAVTLADLLLLFLYLEVLSMVSRYYGSGKMPVRFPIYIGIVALARYLILDVKEMDEWRVLAVAAAILLLAAAVLVIRFGHTRFPYPEDDPTAEIRARKIRGGD